LGEKRNKNVVGESAGVYRVRVKMRSEGKRGREKRGGGGGPRKERGGGGQIKKGESANGVWRRREQMQW